MKNLKNKIYEKIFKTKKIEEANSFYSSTNLGNSPIFNQQSEAQEQVENHPLNQVIDINDVKVTSSYIIPLNQNFQDNPKPKSERNMNPHSLVQYPSINLDTTSTALIQLETNFKIPKSIAFEIKASKMRQWFLSAVCFTGAIASILAIVFYFTNFLSNMPHPALTIPLLILTLTILSINILDYINLRREVRGYIKRTIKGTLTPPNFILQNYRKIHSHLIIINWVSFTFYLYGGLIIGLMLLISGNKIIFFKEAWTVNFPNFQSDVIVLAIFLGVIFIINMLNLILFRYRKNNILSFYGYEIIHPEILNAHKKKINRLCLILFVGITAIIFFLVAIPIFIFKYRKGKKIAVIS